MTRAAGKRDKRGRFVHPTEFCHEWSTIDHFETDNVCRECGGDRRLPSLKVAS